jgi:DNA polymerase-3 subunit delta'
MPFRDIIGHDRLIRLLLRAVARDSLPPSLTFSGPPGIGKATTAIALCQRVNCERVAAADRGGEEGGARAGAPPLDDACGDCAACRRVARAATAFSAGERPAVDCLQWLEPDDRHSIKIDPVREVLRRAGYRPFDGRQRVAIINDADALEVEAQQALLKMLEEPPPATRFVLVTPQPDALLPTIRSRCPQLRFAPIPAAAIAAALVVRYGWAPEQAQAAAAVADGRLGRALRAEQAPWRHTRDLAAEVLRSVAGSRRPADRLDAAQVLVAPEPGRTKAEGGRGKSAAVSRRDLSARLDAMSALLRDIGVVTARADRHRLANADLSAQLEELALSFHGDRLIRAFSTVDQARAALDYNASQKVVADWLVLHL